MAKLPRSIRPTQDLCDAICAVAPSSRPNAVRFAVAHITRRKLRGSYDHFAVCAALATDICFLFAA